MQLLSQATKGEILDCAGRIYDSIPPIVWFQRRQGRRMRGGVSLLQYRALYLIKMHPLVNLSAVAEHIVASLPTASRMIAVLEGKGYVQRTDSRDDRRQVELRITPEGEKVVDEMRQMTLEKMGQVLSKLDEGQRATVNEAMKLLKEVFEPAWIAGGGSGFRKLMPGRVAEDG